MNGKLPLNIPIRSAFEGEGFLDPTGLRSMLSQGELSWLGDESLTPGSPEFRASGEWLIWAVDTPCECALRDIPFLARL